MLPSEVAGGTHATEEGGQVRGPGAHAAAWPQALHAELRALPRRERRRRTARRPSTSTSSPATTARGCSSSLRRGTWTRPAATISIATVKLGIPGTYMPSFLLFKDDEVGAIVEYIRWLSMRGEFEQKVDVEFEAEQYTSDAITQRRKGASARRDRHGAGQVHHERPAADLERQVGRPGDGVERGRAARRAGRAQEVADAR